MNGSLERINHGSVRPATPLTLIDREPISAIYGLFKDGICLYVGSTRWPVNRYYTHHCLKKELPKPFDLVVLRWAHIYEAPRIERQVTIAYWRRGQAAYSKIAPTNFRKKKYFKKRA